MVTKNKSNNSILVIEKESKTYQNFFFNGLAIERPAQGQSSHVGRTLPILVFAHHESAVLFETCLHPQVGSVRGGLKLLCATDVGSPRFPNLMTSRTVLAQVQFALCAKPQTGLLLSTAPPWCYKQEALVSRYRVSSAPRAF